MRRGRDGGGIVASSLISAGLTLGIGAVMALLLQTSYGWVRAHFLPGIPELPFLVALGFLVCPKFILSRK